jgi:hypothetical protein
LVWFFQQLSEITKSLDVFKGASFILKSHLPHFPFLFKLISGFIVFVGYLLWACCDFKIWIDYYTAAHSRRIFYWLGADAGLAGLPDGAGVVEWLSDMVTNRLTQVSLYLAGASDSRPAKVFMGFVVQVSE